LVRPDGWVQGDLVGCIGRARGHIVREEGGAGGCGRTV
jgi:hypothetical protein